jgi:hypothetical protein
MERLYVDIGMILMLATYVCIYRWFVAPGLGRLDRRTALTVLVLVHCGRAMGFVALMPGITLPGLPPEFAYPVAWGDVATGTFALIGVLALRYRWGWAVPWLWFMNTFGAVDILNAGFQLAAHDGFRYLGSDYFVFIWFVPILLISRVAIYRRLFARPVLAAA